MTISISDEGTSYCVQCELYAKQIEAYQEAIADLQKSLKDIIEKNT